MAERSISFASALLFGLLATNAPPAWSDTRRQWDFQVTLDGQPIGEHRFMSTASGDDRQISSDASFVVKMLGLTVYRYRHQAIEQWRGNCLTGLASSTEENGKTTRVRAEAEGPAPVPGDTAQPLVGCVMSFAYWNPAILTQTRLFNAQTGRAETVQVKPQGSDTVEVRGVPVAASRWRITGTAQPIDLWYAADGEWIGLDSTVSGGRRLSYRLK